MAVTPIQPGSREEKILWSLIHLGLNPDHISGLVLGLTIAERDPGLSAALYTTFAPNTYGDEFGNGGEQAVIADIYSVLTDMGVTL